MAYTKQTWACGDEITAEKLNNIEDGIEEALECCGSGSGLEHILDGVADGSLRSSTSTEEGSSVEIGGETVTYALGNGAFAEGINSIASGASAHAEGGAYVYNGVTYTAGTTASGGASHAEGYGTTASEDASHAEGDRTTASGYASHAEGYKTTASEDASHAEGRKNAASGIASHAEGGAYWYGDDWYDHPCEASGVASHAEGGGTTASGNDSHAEGVDTTASGYASHAEGVETTASEDASHAEGRKNAASGIASHAEGYGTTASGYASHAEGHENTASGSYSHAEGDRTTASGYASHAEGCKTTANHKSQHVFGKYNIPDPSTAETTADGTYVEIVGNGSSTTSSNARTLDWYGNETIAGTLTQSSDKRLKEHIDYLGDDASDFIRNLKPAHYIKDEAHHVGFYAQDVAKVDKWDCMTDEMNGFMTLGYTEIIAPLVAYCQTLEKRIEELEK